MSRWVWLFWVLVLLLLIDGRRSSLFVLSENSIDQFIEARSLCTHPLESDLFSKNHRNK